MRYIEKAAFVGAGITELSFDEIAFVSGGKQAVAPKANVPADASSQPTGSTQPYYSTPINIAGSRTFPKADRCAAAATMSNGGNVLQGVGLALLRTPAAPAAPFVGGFGTGLAAVGGALRFVNDCD